MQGFEMFVLQYIVPALIGALVTLIGIVLPYVRGKKDTAAEQVATSIKLYEGLKDRLDELEAENKNLREQLSIMSKKNAYVEDLQVSRNELSDQVIMLTSKVGTLENIIRKLIDEMRCYLEKPFSKRENERLNKFLGEVEKQIGI